MGNTPSHQPRSYMRRAIDLAKRAEGFTTPNPMVGCVLVRDDRIVGEGFHAKPGTAHAEAAALRAAGPEAHGATAYVTLEPCNHFGSSPPCADALIKAGIAKVLFAIADPNPIAAGGADALRTAGIEIEQGLCAREATHLNRHWLHHLKTSQPYVTARFAVNFDDKIDRRAEQQKWITSPEATAYRHGLRQTNDGIIVGVQTIIADDPSLTARPEMPAGRPAPVHPLRIVLDSTGRIPLTAKILRATTQGRTLIVTTNKITPLKRTALEKRNAQVLILPADQTGRPALGALLSWLGAHDITSVMIEGGDTVLENFFATGLVNEAWAVFSPRLLSAEGQPIIDQLGTNNLAGHHQFYETAITPCGPDFLFTAKLRHPNKTTAMARTPQITRKRKTR